MDVERLGSIASVGPASSCVSAPTLGASSSRGPLRKDKCALDAASEGAFYIAAPLRTSVVFWPSKRVVIASVQEREVLSSGWPCAVSIRSEMCLLSLSVCGGNAGVQAFSALFSCEWEATELVLGCFGFCPPGRGRKGGVRIDDCALGSGASCPSFFPPLPFSRCVRCVLSIALR